MKPSNIDIIKFIMSSRWTSPRFDQIGCYVIGVLLPTNLIHTMNESKFFNLPLCYKNDNNEIVVLDVRYKDDNISHKTQITNNILDNYKLFKAGNSETLFPQILSNHKDLLYYIEDDLYVAKYCDGESYIIVKKVDNLLYRYNNPTYTWKLVEDSDKLELVL